MYFLRPEGHPSPKDRRMQTPPLFGLMYMTYIFPVKFDKTSQL